MKYHNHLLVLLVLWPLFGGVVRAQSTDRISLPVYLHGSGRTLTGGLMAAVGLRVKDHELALQLPIPIQPNYWSCGVHYRYYLPGGSRLGSPFLTLEGGYGRILAHMVWDGPSFESRTWDLSAGIGMDYALGKRFKLYAQVGLGFRSTRYLEESLYQWYLPYFDGVHPDLHYSFGIKYDIPLRGSLEREENLPQTYSERSRLFISHRSKYRMTNVSENRGSYAGRFSHQFTAEVGLLRWMRVVGGLQFGSMVNGHRTTDFGFQGMGVGLKLHLYQRGRWAFFQDGSVYALNRADFDYKTISLDLGMSMEYRLARGLYLYAGQTLNVRRQKWYRRTHEAHLGLTVSPGELK